MKPLERMAIFARSLLRVGVCPDALQATPGRAYQPYACLDLVIKYQIMEEHDGTWVQISIKTLS